MECASGNAKRYDSAPPSEAKEDLISHRTEDAEDKLALYLDAKIGDREGFKIGDIQKYFDYSLTDSAVQRIARERGFTPNRLSINGRQMRVWCRTMAVNSIHEPKPTWMKD